jgi:hypothetical protein
LKNYKDNSKIKGIYPLPISIAKLQLLLKKLRVRRKQNEAREKPRHRNPPQCTRKGRQDRGGRTDAKEKEKPAAQKTRKKRIKM